MTETTREQFISAAIQLFAERGFYGVSIAAIADKLGLTKQALLHHFGSKERLYGEVLEALGRQLLAAVNRHRDCAPAERLENFFLDFTGHDAMSHEAQCLVIRELMDNRARLQQAETWYLKPFLDRLVETYQHIPGLESVSDMEALAAIYQLIGAVSYFEISQDTLRHMYGRQEFERLKATFPDTVRTLVRTSLQSNLRAHSKTA